MNDNFDRAVADIMATPTEPMNVGCFSAKTCNEWVRDAFNRPNPESLWNGIWYGGEVCCLFADSNLGKSILAVQIGTEIAQRKKVLYFDFELSDKQFQLRYSDEQGCFTFPQNLVRVEINREALQDDFEETIVEHIEAITLKYGADTIIIDNITWMSSESEKGKAATDLMRKLVALKFKYGWSVLVIAHTPKRNMSSPITQNDLAGSKRLFNFFDSVFAIGQSAKDTNLRYLKQIKCRSGEFSYNADNVMVFTIEKNNNFTEFVAIGLSTEREHLRERTDNDDAELLEKITELSGKGLSYRNIASELGISKSMAFRLAKKSVPVSRSETGGTRGTDETGVPKCPKCPKVFQVSQSVSSVPSVSRRNDGTAETERR